MTVCSHESAYVLASLERDNQREYENKYNHRALEPSVLGREKVQPQCRWTLTALEPSACCIQTDLGGCHHDAVYVVRRGRLEHVGTGEDVIIGGRPRR